jgi:hypothetical protein
VTLCVVYTMRKGTRSPGFLVEPQNQGRRVSQFGPQNQQLRVTPGFKAKLNAHSICAQESSLHTYRTENGYRITNVTI